MRKVARPSAHEFRTSRGDARASLGQGDAPHRVHGQQRHRGVGENPGVAFSINSSFSSLRPNETEWKQFTRRLPAGSQTIEWRLTAGQIGLDQMKFEPGYEVYSPAGKISPYINLSVCSGDHHVSSPPNWAGTR